MQKMVYDSRADREKQNIHSKRKTMPRRKKTDDIKIAEIKRSYKEDYLSDPKDMKHKKTVKQIADENNVSTMTVVKYGSEAISDAMELHAHMMGRKKVQDDLERAINLEPQRPFMSAERFLSLKMLKVHKLPEIDSYELYMLERKKNKNHVVESK